MSYCGIRLSTRTGPFKAQFPTPIRPTRMIVWLAEGALLSAIVDEVDMGFSCLLKSLSVVFVFIFVLLSSKTSKRGSERIELSDDLQHDLPASVPGCN